MGKCWTVQSDRSQGRNASKKSEPAAQANSVDYVRCLHSYLGAVHRSSLQRPPYLGFQRLCPVVQGFGKDRVIGAECLLETVDRSKVQGVSFSIFPLLGQGGRDECRKM